MSGFSGFVLKGDRPDSSRRRLLQVLQTLSRDASDTVQQVEGARAAASAYSLNALGPIDRLESVDGWFTGVCGDPVWVEPGEEGAAADSGALIDTLVSGKTDRFRLARGSFTAFAFDPVRGAVHILADSVGVRPVYYYDGPSLFAFATCRRVLKALLEDQAAVDPLALAELVATRRLTGSATIIDKVKVLRGGEWLDFDGETLRVETYLDMRSLPCNGMAFEDAVVAVDGAFRQAVARRMDRVPGRQEAMLSGGLDSRLVAATLREMGADVRTFAVAKPGSADAVLSPLAAAAIGAEHRLVEIPNGERVRAIPFFAYSAALWPRVESSGGRAIWAGDGGSGVLGHTNISEALIAAAAKGGKESVPLLYPGLLRQKIRILDGVERRGLLGKVSAGIAAEIDTYGLAHPERTAFHFDLRNHQFRHLHDYFEDIDIWRIEPILPFYDLDLVELVHQTPIAYFIGHRLYHSLIARLEMHSHGVPWQTYRSQEPCPFPMPANVTDQWSLASTFLKEPTASYAEWFRRLAGLKMKTIKDELNGAYLMAMRIGTRLGLVRSPHASRLAFRIVSQAGEASRPHLGPEILGATRSIDFPAP